MNGQKASLLATDPPYLVDYFGGNHPASKGNKGKPGKDKHWDEYVDPEASVEFFRSFLSLALEHLKPNSAIYQWHAHRRQALVEQAWHQCGLLVHQQIIWLKARGVLTHSHYLWSHEPCFYGWREGRPPSRKPPSNQRTVWELDQQGSSMNIHPTQKPLELFMRPIEYHTEPGDICYEPFLGSGTQLIAADKLGRVCYALEREPQYMDVAVLRWEAFTGEKARKEEQ
jgi:DNA modification methylase